MVYIGLNYKTVLLSLAVINFAIAVLFLMCPNLSTRLNEILKKQILAGRFKTVLDKTQDIDTGIINKRKVWGLAALLVGILLAFMYTTY